jgi:hypothetical protein
MAQPLFAEDHAVDQELALEVFARALLVGAIRVGPDDAGRF